jgi:DNA-directed RNA polymerase sigma subunit (sigma70/sigma32)
MTNPESEVSALALELTSTGSSQHLVHRPARRAWRVSMDLRSYLRRARRAAVLTAEDERHLGWKIINDCCPVSREILTRSSSRLVVAIVRRHVGRGTSLTELIDKANIGLLHAVETFDPAQGLRFSTHASWWIKQAIRQRPRSCSGE